jgi:hypothetical protein
MIPSSTLLCVPCGLVERQRVTYDRWTDRQDGRVKNMIPSSTTDEQTDKTEESKTWYPPQLSCLSHVVLLSDRWIDRQDGWVNNMITSSNISQSGEILITRSFFLSCQFFPNINISTCKQLQINVASELIEDNYIDELSVNLNYRPDYWHFGIPVNNKGNG